MKISNNISYFYPILGWKDDYNIKGLTYKFQRKDTEDNIVIEIDIEQPDSAISALIESGQAMYACVITCSDTFMTRYEPKYKERHFQVEIAKDDVCREVNFKFMIVSTTEIKDYQNESLNNFYEGSAYIPKGAMMALIADADIEATPCGGKSVGDVIKVVENTWSNEIEYEVHNPRIRIALPKEEFDVFDSQGATYQSVLHSTIVYQAILTGVQNLYECRENDYEWVKYLLKEIKNIDEVPDFEEINDEHNYSIEDATIIVNYILKDPFKRAFKDLQKAGINSN